MPFEAVERRLQSFVYAFRGIGQVLRTEANARIHAAATVAVVLAGLAFGIDRMEWLALTLAITLVWVSEVVNTAFEALCDLVSPEPHPKVALAKDVAAGAVLISAIGAVVIAGLVFGRRLLLLLSA